MTRGSDGLRSLFESFKIGDVKLKNRVVMAPMNMVYSDPDGYNSEQWLAWYAARAKGGFGLIITDATVVNPYTWRGSDHLNSHLFTDERYGRMLGVMADTHPRLRRQGVHPALPRLRAPGSRLAPPPTGPRRAPSAIPITHRPAQLQQGMGEAAEAPGARARHRSWRAIGGLEGLKALNDEQYAELESVLIRRDHEVRTPHCSRSSTGRSPGSSPSTRSSSWRRRWRR